MSNVHDVFCPIVLQFHTSQLLLFLPCQNILVSTDLLISCELLALLFDFTKNVHLDIVLVNITVFSQNA